MKKFVFLRLLFAWWFLNESSDDAFQQSESREKVVGTGASITVSSVTTFKHYFLKQFPI